MDEQTRRTYDLNAEMFADRHLQQVPDRLYELAKVFFIKGEPTIDIGSGVGRDTSWLNQNNYPCVGVEPAKGMLELAQQKFPNCNFINDSLPEIKNIQDQSYSNVFVCAVLMHIPENELIITIMSLLRITTQKGKIILSFRDSKNEKDGRLFINYHINHIAHIFESLGSKILLTEEVGDWKNLVIEKGVENKNEGLSQIQNLILRDKRTTSYKLALTRALCEISKYEPNIVTWVMSEDFVQVPLKRIAARWATFYLPLVINNIRQGNNKNLAFAKKIEETGLTSADTSILKRLIDEESKKTKSLVHQICEAIKKGPVRYAGGGKNEIFRFDRLPQGTNDHTEDEHGFIIVPGSFWRELSIFSHWIEESIIFEWARYTEKMNKNKNFGECLDLISKCTQEDKRQTQMIHALLEGQNELKCTWTGETIDKLEIDHMVPWSIWHNNDIWNLLPTKKSVNGNKSDSLPSPELIKKRFDCIKHYWEIYCKEHTNLFQNQIYLCLGITMEDAFKKTGLEALQHTVMRVHQMHGGDFWLP
jgi:ubiquinone/menaquinone biosynthesis C-methylase UbiE